MIEGLNNNIKAIKRIAFGYRHFENMKKRILVTQSIVNRPIHQGGSYPH
ncbi:MAG: transposase [Lachnospirales bacterium]